jgi:hypothetical protein
MIFILLLDDPVMFLFQAQPASHVPPTASDKDPLSGVKIPCFGDQLTQVRFAGAKDLCASCHSAKDRLDQVKSSQFILPHIM